MTAKTGPIVTVRTLEADAHEVLMISSKGQTIRVGLKDIPVLGRTTQGVRVMKMSDGDVVSSVGIVAERPDDTEKEKA